MAEWRNHFSQLLNVLGVIDVRQTEVHTAEPLVPGPSAFEVEILRYVILMATEKLKSHKSAAIDQIQAEFIKVLGRRIRSEFHKHNACIWR